MKMLLCLCPLLYFFSALQAVSSENAEYEGMQDTNNPNINNGDLLQEAQPQQAPQEQPDPQTEDQQTENEDRQISDNDESSGGLTAEEKRKLKEQVHEVLNDNFIESISPEDKSEKKILEHTVNLEKNIEALHEALHEFKESKKAENSKVKHLYSLVRSAFMDYFGDDIPNDEQLKPQWKTDIKREKTKPLYKTHKSKHNSAKLQNSKKIYTVKQRISAPKTYKSSPKQYTIKSWAGYGSKNALSNNFTGYKIKTFGTQNNAITNTTQKFTVKSPYFNTKPKKCCGN